MLNRRTKKEIKKKIAESQQFEDKKDKAKQMYANAPVFKALMYVALPGILISFMQGMFIFADQIMMVNLIPAAGSPNMNTLFGDSFANAKNFINAWNYFYKGDASLQISTFSIDSLVRFTVSLITPGLYILNAITILIGMGTAVNFSKAIGAKNKEMAYDAWSTGVMSSIVVSIVSSMIIIGVSDMWITSSAGSVQSQQIKNLFSVNITNSSGQKENALLYFENSKIDNYSFTYKQFLTGDSSIKQIALWYQNAKTPVYISPFYTINGLSTTDLLSNPYKDIYESFYIQYHTQAIKWATLYLRIDAGFNIFACFNQYFSLMIRAEGRQLFPALLAAFANGLNIALDAIFIMVLKLGIDGSVAAMVIGWGFNVIMFLIYIGIMQNKTNIVTYLRFSRIKFRYFKWDILWVAIGIGVGASIWNAGIAVQGTLQDMMLSQTTISTKLPVSPSYYVELNGAMLPIVNLCFTALYGVVQGGRALMSYSYGARRYDRVRQEYWQALGIAIVYGIFIYLLIGWGINQYILDGFNITEGIPDPANAQKFFHNAQFFLKASILQLLTYAFAMPCILLFQSIGKILSACITSALQGFVFSFVALYGLNAVADVVASSADPQTGMNVFLYALPIDSFLTALVCFSWSVPYLKFRLGKPTHFEINKMVQRLKKVDLSRSNDKVEQKIKLPKSLVVLLKN